MKVYLAGGFKTNWQEKVKEIKSLECISPKDKENKAMSLKEYGTWDLHYIKNCDIVFAYMERTNPSGIGLACEIGYAYGIGKTVITVLEKDNQFHEDRYMSFIEKVSHIVFETFEEGLEYLKNFK